MSQEGSPDPRERSVVLQDGSADRALPAAIIQISSSPQASGFHSPTMLPSGSAIQAKLPRPGMGTGKTDSGDIAPEGRTPW